MHCTANTSHLHLHGRLLGGTHTTQMLWWSTLVPTLDSTCAVTIVTFQRQIGVQNTRSQLSRFHGITSATHQWKMDSLHALGSITRHQPEITH